MVAPPLPIPSPQGSAFQPANGLSPKSPLFDHANGGSQAAAAQTRGVDLVLDGDSDSSADDGVNYLYGNMPEGAESVIGVSISRVQTRLTSPLTPMAEKIATLESMGGVRQFDEDPDEVGKATTGSFAEGEGKPSPTSFQRSDASKSVLRDLTASTRPRSSSGLVGSGGKRFLPFSLPSMPKGPSLPSFSFPSLNSPLPFLSTQKGNSINGGSQVKARKRKAFSNDPAGPVLPTEGTVNQCYGGSWSGLQPAVSAETGNQAPERTPGQILSTVSCDTVGERLGALSVRYGPQERPGPLRRATSDNSLSLRRTLSAVSSLGDDSRFETVHTQVNSRFKAIKDSFQDTNFNFPSMASVNISLRVDGSTKKRKPITQTPVSVVQGESTLPKLPVAHPDPKNRATNTPRSPNNSMDCRLLDALDKLTGDVVIMGGYRGSKLHSAKPPYRRVWIPIKAGLNLCKVDLGVGLKPEDEENMEEAIVPRGMLTHIGPVDISRRLLKRLRQCENARDGRLRVWDYGYDWRLSPHLLSKKLTKFIEDLPSNACGLPPSERGALVIAHSLGGLITRHAVNKRPDLFSGVIYAGTPQSCVNILGPLRNGDEVLLSSRVLTAQVNFTMRTSFVLLPEDRKCFIDIETKEQYPVDFFDVESWIKYRLSPCVAPPLPTSSSAISLGSLVGSVSGSFSSLPLSLKNRRSSSLGRIDASTLGDTHSAPINDAVNSTHCAASGKDQTPATLLGSKIYPSLVGDTSNAPNTSVSIAVSISPEDATTYLRRTLAETLRFKQELHYRPEHGRNNAYPPLAVIYGKAIPTVCGARVLGRGGIAMVDAYDNLAFASGDGVCLARKAMLPKGYQIVKNGRRPRRRDNTEDESPNGAHSLPSLNDLYMQRSQLRLQQLTKEDEATTGSDEVEVRREDQDNINKFSRLHQREVLLEEELKVKQKDKEDLEEISTELELADEDDLIPYKIGDSFVSLPLPEVQELLSRSTGRIDKDVETLEEKLVKVREEKVGLKVVLYARFGRSINLEA
ncbi:MAG: hypothetical protein M1840_008050 [Geoglossum simile]|nr:MAG: hypothetical protein M1840_008050 [Geoglossum simile]